MKLVEKTPSESMTSIGKVFPLGDLPTTSTAPRLTSLASRSNVGKPSATKPECAGDESSPVFHDSGLRCDIAIITISPASPVSLHTTSSVLFVFRWSTPRCREKQSQNKAICWHDMRSSVQFSGVVTKVKTGNNFPPKIFGCWKIVARKCSSCRKILVQKSKS